MDDFERSLDRYADLLVTWAMNVQPGQIVYIGGEPIHRYFCGKILKRAYEKGAKYVHVSLNAPEFLKSRLESTKDESDLSFIPTWFPTRYDELIDEKAATLRLTGSENPEILSQLDPKRVNAQQLATRKALKRFYSDGVGKSQVSWNVAAHATPLWGQKVFPELPPEEACRALWNELFKICRVDREDYLEEWNRHDDALKRRGKMCDDLKIEALHFIGPGTDLRVFLSRKRLFTREGVFQAERCSLNLISPRRSVLPHLIVDEPKEE